MIRIVGTNLDEQKRVTIALTAIYGIGPTTAQKIVRECRLAGDPKVKDISEAELERLRVYIDKNLTVESDAKIIVSRNIKRLKDISSYRGLRHISGLPVHGQRTKTNARTKRGRKVTMGSGRKKSAAKT